MIAMKIWLLSPLQTLLNGYFSLDPYVATLRQPLLNKIIAIDAKELPFLLYFHFTQTNIVLEEACDIPDATIQGSLFNLTRLAHRENKTAAMLELGIQIQGDMDIAHHFQQFLDSIYIDWEEIIAKIAGDPIAVLFGRAKNKIQRVLRHGKKTVVANVSEYLQEECRFLPPREEIEDFMNDIDLLRADVDRLIARIQRLEDAHE